MSSSVRNRRRDVRFQLQPVRRSDEFEDENLGAPYVGPVLPSSTATHPKKTPLKYGKYASLLRFYQHSSLARTDVEKLARLLSTSANDSGAARGNLQETELTDSDVSDEEPENSTQVEKQAAAAGDKAWLNYDGTVKRDRLVLSWSDQLKQEDAKVVHIRVPGVRADESADDGQARVVLVTNGGQPSNSLNPRILKQNLAVQLPKARQQAAESRSERPDELAKLIDSRMKTVSSTSAQASVSSCSTAQVRKEPSALALLLRSRSSVEDKWGTANAKPSIPQRHTVQDMYFGVTNYGANAHANSSTPQTSPTHTYSPSKSRSSSRSRIRHGLPSSSTASALRSSVKSSYSNVTIASRDSSWTYVDCNSPAPAPSRAAFARDRPDSIRVSGTQFGVSSRSYMNIVHSPSFRQSRSTRVSTVMFSE